MSSDVSATRLYLGNLPRNVTKKDVEDHFKKHGAGEITEVKLMSGFGFIEYKDAMDAMDVVPDGSDFLGERLTVQFARGPRHRDAFTNPDRSIPRPRRTPHRMLITGLPGDTSWQDLKDFARQSGLDVVYSEVGRDRDGKDGKGFVEFETAADLRTAVEKLDHLEFKGSRVSCVADTQEERPRERNRSRSPPPRRGPTPPMVDYDRRPRGYTPPPRRHEYRERSPRRDYYDSRDRYRSPPRIRGPPDDGYPPPHRRYPDDPYDRVPRRGFEEPYPPPTGYGRERLPSPRGRRTPERRYHDYDRRGAYW